MISRVDTNLSKLSPWMKNPQSSAGAPIQPASERPVPKSIGEVAPKIVDPAHYPQLAALLGQFGFISSIRRRLTSLSGKKGQIVLAENTVGAADNKGLVYLGVDFLQDFQNESAVIAGVLAHEWGHLVSNLVKYGHFEDLNWDELIEIRREEEGSADAFCGRTLPLLGYSVEPLIEFLLKDKDKLGSHKYYDPQLRAQIIREAAKATLMRQYFSRKLFRTSVYPNPYNSVLLIA